MKTRTICQWVAALILGGGFASPVCGYDVVEVTNGGTVKGVVKLKGKVAQESRRTRIYLALFYT